MVPNIYESIVVKEAIYDMFLISLIAQSYVIADMFHVVTSFTSASLS